MSSFSSKIKKKSTINITFTPSILIFQVKISFNKTPSYHNIGAKNECSSTFRYCLGAVFVGKDKLAILSNAKEVGLLDNSGNIKNLPNLPLVDMIYPANMGKIIMRTDTSAILYDTTTRYNL